MARRLPSVILPAAAGLVVAGLAGAAQAGSCTSGCTPPPPSCCNVPTSHQVTVPGITVTPPSVSIVTPTIAVSGASASASAGASAVAGGLAGSSGNVYAVGGGSGFYVDQGSTGVIQNLAVEGPGRPVCISYKKIWKAMAIQAVCLDDKAVPHPASQVTPDRELADGYEGEVFRCIAGARMQYTMAEWADHGGASFDHGQTHVCAKGEALYHTARGELQCRPQSPARDCNERSLLRRYGAGIKIVKAAAKDVCVDYRSSTQTATAGGQMVLDGGVGGVVH